MGFRKKLGDCIVSAGHGEQAMIPFFPLDFFLTLCVCLGWLIWRKEEIAERHTLPDFCWITFGLDRRS